MHANVRQYRMPPADVEAAMHLADTELADRLANEPGFVAYEAMAAEDGTICSVTIFEDREAAERSQELAAEFVREHLSDMDITPIGSMTCEVMVSRAQERVLEAAHR